MNKEVSGKKYAFAAGICLVVSFAIQYYNPLKEVISNKYENIAYKFDLVVLYFLSGCGLLAVALFLRKKVVAIIGMAFPLAQGIVGVVVVGSVFDKPGWLSIITAFLFCFPYAFLILLVVNKKQISFLKKWFLPGVFATAYFLESIPNLV